MTHFAFLLAGFSFFSSSPADLFSPVSASSSFLLAGLAVSFLLAGFSAFLLAGLTVSFLLAGLVDSFLLAGLVVSSFLLAGFSAFLLAGFSFLLAGLALDFGLPPCRVFMGSWPYGSISFDKEDSEVIDVPSF